MFIRQHFWYLTIILLLTTRIDATEIDLLKQAINKKTVQQSGYYQLGDMLHHYRDAYMWRIPEGNIANRIQLGTFPVKPMTRYLLEWELDPAQFMKMLLFAVFEDKDGQKNAPFHIMTFENSSALFKISKEIIIPSNVHKLDLQVFLAGVKITPNANIGFIKSLKLREIGPVIFNQKLKETYNKNVLPISNFEDFEIGKKSLSDLKLMPFKQKSFLTEIVKDKDGRKVLKINYSPGDYQYAAWFTKKLPFYGSVGTIRCKLRGKGRTQIMVWWNRPSFHTIYKHFGYFDLTNEWKEYSIEISCDEPLTQKVAVAIAFRDNNTEVEVSDISLIFNQPKK